MDTLSIVFPHQLYAAHPALAQDCGVVLVEEFLFFRQYKFHKQKIWLHRASMQWYKDWLTAQGYTVVRYVEAHEAESDIRLLIPALAAGGIRRLRVADPSDDWLQRRLQKTCSQHEVELVRYPSPNFLTPAEDAHRFFDGRHTYFQTDFYTWQRKRMRLLLDPQGKPVGGKWSFDADNRQRLPRGVQIPAVQWPATTAYGDEAREYVDRHFAENYGTLSMHWEYPITHEAAADWLQQFLQHRFAHFGDYEDAMARQELVLWHSVLTPMLNIGLLQPQQVLEATLQHAAQHAIPLNSLEGFVRQVSGWREFIRMVYLREGRKQRTRNYWGFTRKIPQRFWTGETGIGPVDQVIRKTLATGYNHHIERLMVLGNFFLLCEFDPDEVYRWFMEMYVDAYDWVMVPNVYGMTQFADGGLMTTKPYISGSNYLMKMGDWEKGPWQEIWDALFWRFMHVHRGFFLQNPRLGMLVKTFDKMDDAKKEKHLQAAESFLASLDKQLA